MARRRLKVCRSILGGPLMCLASSLREPKLQPRLGRRWDETWPVCYFQLGDLPHPAVGDSAVWLLRQGAVDHLLECAQRRGMTSAYCSYDVAYVVESDDDVLPAATWQEVSELLRSLGQPSVQNP